MDGSNALIFSGEGCSRPTSLSTSSTERSARRTTAGSPASIRRSRSPIRGRSAAGQITTTGRLTGPYGALRFQGNATVNRLEASDVSALTLTGDYDVTVPSGEAARSNARVNAHGSFLTVFGQSLQTDG